MIRFFATFFAIVALVGCGGTRTALPPTSAVASDASSDQSRGGVDTITLKPSDNLTWHVTILANDTDTGWQTMRLLFPVAVRVGQGDCPQQVVVSSADESSRTWGVTTSAAASCRLHVTDSAGSFLGPVRVTAYTLLIVQPYRLTMAQLGRSLLQHAACAARAYIQDGTLITPSSEPHLARLLGVKNSNGCLLQGGTVTVEQPGFRGMFSVWPHGDVPVVSYRPEGPGPDRVYVAAGFTPGTGRVVSFGGGHAHVTVGVTIERGYVHDRAAVAP